MGVSTSPSGASGTAGTGPVMKEGQTELQCAAAQPTIAPLSNPSSTSVCTVRSCASSMITTCSTARSSTSSTTCQLRVAAVNTTCFVAGFMMCEVQMCVGCGNAYFKL